MYVYWLVCTWQKKLLLFFRFSQFGSCTWSVIVHEFGIFQNVMLWNISFAAMLIHCTIATSKITLSLDHICSLAHKNIDRICKWRNRKKSQCFFALFQTKLFAIAQSDSWCYSTSWKAIRQSNRPFTIHAHFDIFNSISTARCIILTFHLLISIDLCELLLLDEIMQRMI